MLLAGVCAIMSAYAAIGDAGVDAPVSSAFDTPEETPAVPLPSDVTEIPASDVPQPVAEQPVAADPSILPAENLPHVRPGDLKFPVAKNYPATYDDLENRAPIDLKTPENILSEIEFDTDPARYIFRSKAGGTPISEPYMLTDEEYRALRSREMLQDYWNKKNAEALETSKTGKNNSLFNFQFDLGLPSEIFGPGGVRVDFTGSSEISLGFRQSRVDNPVLSERMRKPPIIFDFNEKIQANVNASVGDKISFGLNYNTESSFDFDQQRIKLVYDATQIPKDIVSIDESIGFPDALRDGYSAVSGKSYSSRGADQILRKVEAGNVSMQLSSALIRGSSSLFGIKTEMQFGKLNVQALLSQQESESKTINLRGGAQTTPFEIQADSYDENRHFFLAQYFRSNYDRWMSSMPHINSGITINRVEVWVTNRRGDFDQARNIVAFADLGEPARLYDNPNRPNSPWTLTAGATVASNGSNDLYGTFSNIDTSPIRDIAQVTSTLSSMGLEGGNEYDKIESARRLLPSEYTVNTQLGFISLRNALNADEVLAVAYEYTFGGNSYQVGEFSSDPITPPATLILKLLKSTVQSPNVASWDLMMKNIYALGGYQLQPDNFRLDVTYQSDSTGMFLNYIPGLPDASPVKNKLLLQVMRLDRLNRQQQPRPDGIFDFVEGATVQSSTGRIIFPVIEPFGAFLANQLGDTIANPDLAQYVFWELYRKSLTDAREITEKNKFRLTGEYQSSSGSEIRLNAMNVPKGSVSVTAGGVQLVENVDYTVDYNMGVVNILNTAILESGTNISISLENRSFFSMQRKTLMGTHLDYAFSDDFNIGATLMHLSEKPLTQKVAMGSEPISNTIWGLNTSYRTDSEWITRMMDRLPLLRFKAPSSIVASAEFAQLLPGTSSAIQGMAYIDDFEGTKTTINLSNPFSWRLASVPTYPDLFDGFDAATTASGKKRSHLSWYSIDPIFTRNNSNAPGYIRNDDNMQSSNFVREITEREIFPNREIAFGESIYLPTLNLSFYPQERGPYNLDYTNINPNDGKFTNPKDRWGGIMRQLQTTDFETANIEYVEFWLMDPFVDESASNYKPNLNVNGGDLYLNLGDISEDVLKDGRKSFENGLPTDGSDTNVSFTQWGRVSNRQSMVNAFDGGAAERAAQDVGLDGMNDEWEQNYGDYKILVDRLRSQLSPAALQQMQDDPFSAINDPASDNYHYYRGGRWDQIEADIIERYKRYNGTQGNSPASDSGDTFSSAATNQPDVEDINQDNTLSENERFYSYKVSLRPNDMQVGRNYITDMVEAQVPLRNGRTTTVKWYQFKVPVQDFDRTNKNSPRDFRSIRFMRMFLTGFETETHLRFGTLELVRGEWRTYGRAIDDQSFNVNGNMTVSAVNIEENSSKTPVNYVLPPGISRVLDPSQPQIRQENEQALMLRVNDLAPKDARAVFKNISMDMRQYKRLQMFVHAEQMLDAGYLGNDELTVFMRIGSDNKQNYYEYEIPLKLTPSGLYSNDSEADREAVWPTGNMFNFALQQLIDVKTERNKRRSQGANVSFVKPYSVSDPKNSANTITILGNPSVSDVRTIMIGVRNKSGDVRSGEIWVNELRLTEFNEDSGYAGLANVSLNLSDLGTVNVAGRMETAGFGSIEDNMMGRRLDDYYQYSVSTALELGRLLGEKSKLRVPMFYSYSQEITNPKYNPLDQDVLLKDALEGVSAAERDSIKALSQNIITNQSINFTGIKLDIASAKPRIYDPANFSLSYSFSETKIQNPETVYDVTKDYRATFNYNYMPSLTPWEPFKGVKPKALAIIRDFNVFYLPSQLAFSTTLSRHYNESQLRSFNSEVEIPLSVAKDFTWDRQYDIRYDFSRGLKFALNVATNARIDETLYAPVNRSLFPDEYQNWKDTVMQSLRRGGTPVAYQQTFTANYNIPVNKLPFFEWITATAQYTGNYSWQRNESVTGLDDNDESFAVNLNNTISSLNNWQVDTRFNFETLYNKSKFLRDVNKKFAARPQTPPNRSQTTDQAKQPQPAERKQTETISLKKGEQRQFRHRLNTQYLRLTAKTPDGKDYPLKYKVTDERTVTISPSENIDQLTITLTTFEPTTSPLKIFAESSARLLMMLRNGSVSYKETNTTAISGYIPETGFLGQDGSAPGYGFVFGLQQDRFLETAQQRNWLNTTEPAIPPIAQGYNSDLQIRFTLEPVRSLRIELTANRQATEQNTFQRFVETNADGEIMSTNTVETFSGSFAMSYMALSTSFWKVEKAGNYDSRAYNQFLANREIIAQRLEQQYIDKGKSIGNGYRRNSSDVMIPAFLAAYSNRDAGSGSLNIFPTIAQILPNWRVTYDGLSRLPFFQEHFRSVSINHAYQCAYRVLSYSSFLKWEPIEGETKMGYVSDITNVNGDSKIPSSPYDVSAVAISERFNPLVGVDLTMKNNLTARVEYRISRDLGLNMISSQLIEAASSEWVIGLGYRIENFGAIIGQRRNQNSKTQNDLTLRGDVGLRDQTTIIRRIDDNDSQPSAGNNMLTFKFAADYILSERINLRAFYDYQQNTPFITTSYPTRASNYGVTVRLLFK